MSSLIDIMIANFYNNHQNVLAGGIYLGYEEYRDFRRDCFDHTEITADGVKYYGIPVYQVNAKNHIKVTD